MTCPLCLLITQDYYTALAEAGNASHRDEAELLLDYAEAVGRALYQHVDSHVVGIKDRYAWNGRLYELLVEGLLGTPPSRSESAPERPTVDGDTP